jgi:hypothetical protein
VIRINERDRGFTILRQDEFNRCIQFKRCLA